MRTRSLLLAVLLALTLLVPPSVADEHCAEGEQGCSGRGADDGESGNAGPGGANATGSENASGNESEDEPVTETGSGNGQNGSEERRTAREEEIEQRKAQARTAWREARGSQADGDADQRWETLRERLPADLRDRVGRLVAGEGSVQGTFVDLQPDPKLGVFYDVRQQGTVIFEEVYVPLALGASATSTTQGKVFQLSGNDWSFRMTDDLSAPMYFRTNGDPFLLILPEGAEATSTDYGLQIEYPTADGQPLIGRLSGAVHVDPEDPLAVHVPERAVFLVSAERSLLPQVAQAERGALEDAISHGRVGAEATVLRIEEPMTFVDAVVYDDMHLDLQESTPETAGFQGYTITVDSESRVGKTIAVTFESGLIDPDNLVFRYLNVEADRTVEGAISQASNIDDVLDPLDDGTVAEYWIVQDTDGTQVLVSIPHFSVHQIQLMSLVDLVVERPSLVLGTVGAVLLVAVATAGMFRRPDEA